MITVVVKVTMIVAETRVLFVFLLKFLLEVFTLIFTLDFICPFLPSCGQFYLSNDHVSLLFGLVLVLTWLCSFVARSSWLFSLDSES